jgi:hypothetical protein
MTVATLSPAQRPRLSLLRPAALVAYLAILGRVVVAPVLLVAFVVGSRFMTTAKVLIDADDSYFAFAEMDPVMRGGCVNCEPGCLEVFVKLAHYTDTLLLSKPEYEDLYPLEEYNYSMLNDAAKEVAARIEASETSTCMSGVDEWGSRVTMVAGTPREVLDTIDALGVSVSPKVLREVQNALDTVDDCPTRWVLDTHQRVFRFQTVANSLDFSVIPAADLSIFPEYTECRNGVSNTGLVGETLALETENTDIVAVVPDLVRLFPYSFQSSITEVTTEVSAGSTVYGVQRVTQQMLRAYYGGCRVRVVNVTGVYIEEGCKMNSHWLNYGLMIQMPDDLPVCSTADVCIHNYYNSLWEFVTYINPDTPERFPIAVNSFRLRYADKVDLSVLPGIVVMQILAMGWVSLYQTMSHKRSVLLAQIWAYRCQNGNVQLAYLAQISYHLIYNSDLYFIGLTTGTLTVESIGNLTLCLFAFSYSFVNMIKARSGEQRLDRCFRLTWEVVQVVSTTIAGIVLYQYRITSISSIMEKNGELLRKTSPRGAKFCNLSDSCIVFSVSIGFVAVVISLALGFIPLAVEFILRLHDRLQQGKGSSLRGHNKNRYVVYDSLGTIAAQAQSTEPGEDEVEPSRQKVVADTRDLGTFQGKGAPENELTSFERNCLGSKFTRMFNDCDDFAYVTYRNQRCSSVEAVLLSGFLYYGKNIYQAPAVLMLLVARVIPRSLLRSFNVLLIRWHLDTLSNTVSYPQSCTWYSASADKNKLSEAVPIR